MLTIFVANHTNRIDYTFRLIFKDLLDIDFCITSNKEEFAANTGHKFSYGEHKISDEVFFKSSGLLESTGIQEIKLEVSTYKNTAVLFPLHEPASALPFDPFASAFYIATRYEEYLPYIADKLGRFEAAAGIAHQQGFLQLPVVNLWAAFIRDTLKNKYPEIPEAHRKFRFIPTYDIDIAYSYLHKGTVRGIAAAAKDLLKGNFRKLKERFDVLRGNKADPYDSYEFMFELQEQYGLCANYFIHAGTWGKYDKSIAPETEPYASLLRKINSLAEIGIHPSWQSTEKPDLIKQEMMRIESVIGEPITQARQHFIKLKFPDTYRNYIAAGIIDDYSMGFASDIGFRAGLCSSFFFYDLVEERETKLRIHPFAIMDGTLKDYLNISAGEALPVIEKIMKQVAAVGGTFITIFHNESLGTSAKWDGWRNVYREMTEMANSLS